MRDTITTRTDEMSADRQRPTPRRGLTAAVCVLLATLAISVSMVTFAAPADAAVSSTVGGYADTRMKCSVFAMPGGGFNKTIQLDVRNLRGFDYARVYRLGSNGGSGYVTGTAQTNFWVPASQVQRLTIHPTNYATAVIVQYLDWDGHRWQYPAEYAIRTDGGGIWC